MVNLKFKGKRFFFFLILALSCLFLYNPCIFKIFNFNSKIHFLCILVLKLERRETKFLASGEERESYWFNYFLAMIIVVFNVNRCS
jgi:hypothetical protein